jgi:hypothetical protein
MEGAETDRSRCPGCMMILVQIRSGYAPHNNIKIDLHGKINTYLT